MVNRLVCFAVSALVSATIYTAILLVWQWRTFDRNLVIVLPVALVVPALMIMPVAGALAIVGWVLFKRRDSARDRITFGALLGLATYLVWVWFGVGAPSEGTTVTFAQNLQQGLHIHRGVAAMVAGAAGWTWFRRLRCDE